MENETPEDDREDDRNDDSGDIIEESWGSAVTENLPELMTAINAEFKRLRDEHD